MLARLSSPAFADTIDLPALSLFSAEQLQLPQDVVRVQAAEDFIDSLSKLPKSEDSNLTHATYLSQVADTYQRSRPRQLPDWQVLHPKSFSQKSNFPDFPKFLAKFIVFYNEFNQKLQKI